MTPLESALRLSPSPASHPSRADELVGLVVELFADAVADRVLERLEATAGDTAPTAPWHLLDIGAVAAILGRSKRWVHDAIKQRGLPYIRLDGGALAFDPDDVRAWARARRVPETEPETLSGRCQVPANGRLRLTGEQKVRAR